MAVAPVAVLAAGRVDIFGRMLLWRNAGMAGREDIVVRARQRDIVARG
jgi:hypothetical protein